MIKETGNDEFDMWYRNHLTAFPSINTWLAKFPAGGVDDTSEQITAYRIGQRWRRLLSNVPLAIAIEATDKMERGEIKEPRGFDRHAQAIYGYWKSTQKGSPTQQRKIRLVDGEPVFDCLDCGDSLIVLVFTEKAVAQARLGDFDDLDYLREAMACDCRASLELNRRRKRPYVVFDRRGNVLSCQPDSIEKLREFVSQEVAF